MSRWPSVALREIAAIERETINASAIKDGTVYVGLENIETGGNFLGVRKVKSGELASGKFAFSSSHVLFGKLRPYLAKIARPAFVGVCSTDILPLSPGPKLDRDYLAHFLLKPDTIALLSSLATGANLPRLSPRALAEIKIPCPPIMQQRRIAAILDKADALRAQRRAALAQLDTLTQSIFLDMFGDPATNPKGFPTRTLEAVCRSVTDIDHKMPLAVDAGKPFISAKDLTDDGKISFENVKKISEEDFLRLSRKSKPEKGDIIYSRIGVNLGKARKVEVDFDFLASYSCCTIKPNRSLIDGTYLCSLLDSPFMLMQAHKGVRAIAVPDLGMGEIKAFRILVPNMKMQKEFSKRIECLEKVKVLQRSSLGDLEALFACLQHRAFSGEL